MTARDALWPTCITILVLAASLSPAVVCPVRGDGERRLMATGYDGGMALFDRDGRRGVEWLRPVALRMSGLISAEALRHQWSPASLTHHGSVKSDQYTLLSLHCLLTV